MSRAFEHTPIEPALIDSLLDTARRAPSAGNTASVEFLVLDEPDATASYWDTTLPEHLRQEFPWPRLLSAPVLVVPWVDPSAYLSRYDEDDKRHRGLGKSIARWPVPYWFVDGGAAVMSLLLGAEEAGLGALFFGLFENEDAVRSRFDVPNQRRAVGAVALGHRAAERVSLSSQRVRSPLDEVVHRGRWRGLV